MSIRILIADDHTVVAEGLKHLIEAQPELEVIGIVPDGREAVRLAKETQPGDTTGQGIQGVWYVVGVNGQPIK